jgi:ABC-type nitrate/sulfonate/bicarbonate transport system substrate-binding protein
MSTNYAFEPETVEALVRAFDKSWSFISNDPLLATADLERLRRRLAKYLMQLAAEGERDPLRLGNGAIRRMRQEHSLEAAQ